MADQATAASITGTATATCKAERQIVVSSPDRVARDGANEKKGNWTPAAMGVEAEGPR